jgi:hypothetical protein
MGAWGDQMAELYYIGHYYGMGGWEGSKKNHAKGRKESTEL